MFHRDVCVEFVPDLVLTYKTLSPTQIFDGMAKCLKHLDPMTSTELDFKIDVLDILRRWPMFGASFYKAKVLQKRIHINLLGKLNCRFYEWIRLWNCLICTFMVVSVNINNQLNIRNWSIKGFSVFHVIIL